MFTQVIVLTLSKLAFGTSYAPKFLLSRYQIASVTPFIVFT
jgi:hypothetical protein